MDFKIGEDMKMNRELLNLTLEELAVELDETKAAHSFIHL